MAKSDFGKDLFKARDIRGISRRDLAEKLAEMAKQKEQRVAPQPKGIEGQISRWESGARVPSERRITEIVDALCALADDTAYDKDQLLANLMAAASKGIGDTDDQLTYLRRQCESALSDAGLKRHQVRTILEHATTATLRRIAVAAKTGEGIDFIDLGQLSRDLRKIAKDFENQAGLGEDAGADHVIKAGRARILINGELSARQRKLLEDMTRMIRNILES